jgi:hypothetical protein
MVLDSDTEEHLLRDIERKGLPLDQVSLVDICDADPAIYGRSGKPRRPVQQRWGKIKRLKPRGYLALLKKHKIPPSPATLAAGAEGKESKEPEPTETIIDNDNEDTIEDGNEGTILDDDEEAIIDDDDDEQAIIDDDDEPTTNDSISNIASTLASLSIKPTRMFNTPTRTSVSG